MRKLVWEFAIRLRRRNPRCCWVIGPRLASLIPVFLGGDSRRHMAVDPPYTLRLVLFFADNSLQ
jgi:hypothetical protein